MQLLAQLCLGDEQHYSSAPVEDGKEGGVYTSFVWLFERPMLKDQLFRKIGHPFRDPRDSGLLQ